MLDSLSKKDIEFIQRQYLEYTSEYGSMSLHEASKNSDLSLVAYILDKDYKDTTLPLDEDGYDPLFRAMEYMLSEDFAYSDEYEGIFQLLVQHGASIEALQDLPERFIYSDELESPLETEEDKKEGEESLEEIKLKVTNISRLLREFLEEQAKKAIPSEPGAVEAKLAPAIRIPATEVIEATKASAALPAEEHAPHNCVVSQSVAAYFSSPHSAERSRS